ncbi:MAG: MATE family efflux transporter [Bacteroidota bacterium]
MQVNSSYRDIWRMAYPVMIGALALTFLNVIDTIFLGRIGETELGASALGGVFYFVMVMIGVALGVGTQIQIARRAGEKNHGAIGEIFDHSFFLLLGLSLLQFIVLHFFSGQLFGMLVDNQEVKMACSEFLKYRSIGIFFVMLATAFRSFYVGIATPKVWSYYSFLMAFVNIILGYGLIFGHLGMPQMGIAGAGLASSIAEAAGLIFLFAYTKMKNTIREFQLFRFKSLNMEIVSKTISLSLPLVVQNLISMGAWFVFFVFIEKMGKHSLAISNITRSVYMIDMTPMWGFSVAANSMVSNLIGQGRKNEVMPLVIRIIKMATVISLAIVLVNVLFPIQLLHLFSADESLIRDSYGSLLMVSLAMIIFPMAIVCISAVSGTGATRTALYIEIVAILIYMLYLVLVVFKLNLSLEIAWFAEAIYWLFTGVVSYLFLRSLRWTKISI